ncbi:MAG TPA: DinB family protein [Dehalococcoidia bacterium]|nr:DinB family protein [Dehalococcoidia bacterium]
MASRREVANGLKEVARRASEASTALAEDSWDRPLPGQDWSTHDLFCHLAATGTNLPEFVGVALDPPPNPPPLDIDAWNDEQVSVRRQQSKTHILAEIQDGHDSAATFIHTLPEENMARPVQAPWGEMVPLGDLLMDIVVGHENRHLDQLEELTKA